MPRVARVLVIALALGTCASAPAQDAAPQDSARWTLPATLSDCGGERPSVVFPSKEPTHASGPGAVVWDAGASCPGIAERRLGTGTRVATLTSADLPREGSLPRSASGGIYAARALAAVAAPHGEVAIVGIEPDVRDVSELIQGPAGGPFSELGPAPGLSAPFSLATGWLGDLALVDEPQGAGKGALALHVERFYSHGFVRNEQVGVRPGALGALAVALDYRTDALVAWEHGGWLYARELPGRGAPARIQRLARASGQVSVAVLLSDDYRGIVAWSEERAGAVRVYFDQSSVGVRFRGPPQLLESFEAPVAAGAPAPRLIRLSNESVMMAWSGADAGAWVVRTAAIDQHGIGAPSTLSALGAGAQLDALAAGPEGEALVLWSELQEGEAGVPNQQGTAIYAARGFDEGPRRTVFGAPEEVAPPGPNSEATVAVDPASDRAVAVWQNGSALQYAVRAAGG